MGGRGGRQRDRKTERDTETERNQETERQRKKDKETETEIETETDRDSMCIYLIEFLQESHETNFKLKDWSTIEKSIVCFLRAHLAIIFREKPLV